MRISLWFVFILSPAENIVLFHIIFELKSHDLAWSVDTRPEFKTNIVKSCLSSGQILPTFRENVQ